MFVEKTPKKFNLLMQQMSDEQLKVFIHNQFPQGRKTVLHLIGKDFLAVDALATLSKEEKFVVPFLLDQDEKSVMDYAIEANDSKQVNALMRLLSKAPLDHHSRLIAHLLPSIIKMDLPACEKYFDRRRFQPGCCIDIQSGRLRIQNGKSNVAMPSELLADKEDDLRKTFMAQNQKEQQVNVEILDIPL